MKILAIQNRMGIGDMVIFLPFIEAISKKFNSPVSILVKENSKALEYLEKICEKYSEFFFNYSESPLLVLNVDDVDFVTSQLDYEKVRDCLQRDIVGKEFVNLSPSFF